MQHLLMNIIKFQNWNYGYYGRYEQSRGSKELVPHESRELKMLQSILFLFFREKHVHHMQGRNIIILCTSLVSHALILEKINIC